MKEKDLTNLEEIYNQLTSYKCGKHLRVRQKLYEEIKRVGKLLGYKNSIKIRFHS